MSDYQPINGTHVLELREALKETVTFFMGGIGAESITGVDVILAFDAALMDVKEKMLSSAAKDKTPFDWYSKEKDHFR